MIYTYQDFEEGLRNIPSFLASAISNHRNSLMFKTAVDADSYSKQMNSTITKFLPVYYDILGRKMIDHEKVNHKICCNFFDYLNSQRCNYSLGEGINFVKDDTHDKLGEEFDDTMIDAGYYALTHGESFLFWNGEKLYLFKLTEFVPLLDEDTGALRAGIRYWQIDHDKPLIAVLYEEDGYSVYRSESGGLDFKLKEEKRAYMIETRKAPADAEAEIIGESNWGRLPIFPMWGSKHHQSTLVGMKGGIDAYDMGKSGFANSMDGLNELLTIVSNANGMDERDILQVKNWMDKQGIIAADEGQISTLNRSVDHAARTAFLTELRQGIFEDFGGLDVHTIMAGATNDHISAAYEPLNAQADGFEKEVTRALTPLLRMLGIDDKPTYKRRAIANDAQYNANVMSAAEYLDERTVLEKLTFIDNDEIDDILARKAENDVERFTDDTDLTEDTDEEKAEDEDTESNEG